MPDELLDTIVGSYRITTRLAVGGMGTVYRAVHTLLGRPAAVKILHPELRSNRDIVNRFFNEAKATTRIQHPGIVEIFDFGYLPSGDGYLVMELLDGISLAQRLKGERLLESEIAVVLRGVCSALAAAHAKGIIHRDLKPDNIFLCVDPDSPIGVRPKVLDFGIAKLSDPHATAHVSATRTGALMGTPTYMSPEQCRGAGEVDLRSDLYALGCIFYEALCGRPPFHNMGSGEIIASHLFVEPEPPSTYGASLTPESEQLLRDLLAKSPEQRPQSAAETSRRFGAIAQLHGFSINTNPVGHARVSLSTIDPPPATTSPDVHVPLPTTLSSVASQSIVTPRRPKGRVWLGIGAVAIGVTLAFTAQRLIGGREDGSVVRPTSNAAAPAIDESLGASPTPSAPRAPIAPPVTESPPVTDAPPVATPAVPPPPAVELPAPSEEVAAETPVTTPTTRNKGADKRPDRRSPASKRPDRRKPAGGTAVTTEPRPTPMPTPAVTKPAPTPTPTPAPAGTGSGSASRPKILIETDL